MPRLTPPPNLNPRTPKLALPAGAVDCHVHMFGPRSKYPFGPDAHYISEDATAEMYFAIQARLGLSKAVLVSGGGYGQTYTHLADTLQCLLSEHGYTDEPICGCPTGVAGVQDPVEISKIVEAVVSALKSRGLT